MGRYRAPIQKAKMGMPRNVPKLLAPSVLHSAVPSSVPNTIYVLDIARTRHSTIERVHRLVMLERQKSSEQGN